MNQQGIGTDPWAARQCVPDGWSYQLTSNYKHQDLRSVAPLGKGPDGVVVVLNSRYKQAVVAVGFGYDGAPGRWRPGV
jgi:hypothetical protein